MFPTEVLPVHYIEVCTQEQKAARAAELARQQQQAKAQAEAQAQAAAKSQAQAQARGRAPSQPTAAQLHASLREAMPTPLLSQPQPGRGVIAGIYSNLFSASRTASPMTSTSSSTAPSRTQTPATTPRMEKTPEQLAAERDQGICTLPSWH